MGNDRRDFLKKSALLSFGSLVSSAIGADKIQKLEELGEMIVFDGQKFSLPSLPYAYDAMEPFIDQETMKIHHTKHHQAYVDNLNKAIVAAEPKTLPESLSFHSLFNMMSKLPIAIRNNSGGHYNHSFFWQLLKSNPNGNVNEPSGKVAEGIRKQFGSFDSFKTQFNDAAAKRFGSGWAWLYAENKILKIGSTPNQDNPLMDNAEIKGIPLLALDVWEHAYYLKYQNKRAEYVANWWNLVNWEKVNENYSTL
jgi:superoxide dismutase, Fe-Mn family